MKFDRYILEALDIPDNAPYFHPSKQQYVQNLPSNEKDIITSLYPDLGSETQSYLELITSNSYKQTVSKVEKYLGYSIDELKKKYPSMPSLSRMVFQSIMEVMGVESSHKDILEKMAVEVVLELPEFKMIKDMVEEGELEIKAILDKPDLSNAITQKDVQASQNSLSNAEKDNKEIVQLRDDILAKRSFFKTLSQGNAVNKFYLFHLVEDKLKEIDENLPKKYGVISSLTSLGAYAAPNMQLTKEMVKAAQLGSSEIVDESTIVCRAYTFPFLVHEIVKGIYNYLTYDIANQEELDTETMDQEILELMSGPALYDNFRTLIDVNNQHLIPLILKDLAEQPAEVIRTINTGGNKAKRLMDKLVQRAKDIYDEL